jgi:polyphosphate kinase 2 (PPK2 family)
MNEDTLIRTMPLPHGQLWAYHADANVIVLSPCLDAAGREAAITELQAQWRRSALRVVDDADKESHQQSHAAADSPWKGPFSRWRQPTALTPV